MPPIEKDRIERAARIYASNHAAGLALGIAPGIGRLHDEAKARVVPARPHTGVSRQVGLEKLGEAAESGLCGGAMGSEANAPGG